MASIDPLDHDQNQFANQDDHDDDDDDDDAPPRLVPFRPEASAADDFAGIAPTDVAPLDASFSPEPLPPCPVTILSGTTDSPPK